MSTGRGRIPKRVEGWDSEVAKHGLSVHRQLNTVIGLSCFKEDEVSFDSALPFMVAGLTQKEQYRLASGLSLYRLAVDRYNSGSKIDNAVRRELLKFTGLHVIGCDEYQRINMSVRNDQSRPPVIAYLRATKRVFYRFQIMSQVGDEPREKRAMKRALRAVSAFLLLDDDVFDLEHDLNSGKRSTLIRLIDEGWQLESIVKAMKGLLSQELIAHRRLCMLRGFCDKLLGVYS